MIIQIFTFREPMRAAFLFPFFSTNFFNNLNQKTIKYELEQNIIEFHNKIYLFALNIKTTLSSTKIVTELKSPVNNLT